MTVVDIHCHTFNADDLPVRGFIDKVAGNKVALARLLARAIDTVIQDAATDATRENKDLDRRLATPRRGGLEGIGPPSAAVLEAELERDVAEIIAGFDENATADMVRAEAELGVDASDRPGLEGFGDRFADVKRYLKWAALFGKPRYDLTSLMISTYPDVALFTPMLVDFQGLGDEPTTPVLVQLDLQEKISRLSMRGDLTAAVHPFVGFDPRRPDALRYARMAVDGFGFVGVKMYPPMGFRPTGNAEAPPTPMTRTEAEAVDRALDELFTWCEQHQVPVTAHCNPSNYADDTFKDFSHPDLWRRVLQAHPDLHLNLGHFGWSGRDQEWTTSICRMTNDFEHLYTDIGNHKVEELDESLDHLIELFDPERTGQTKIGERLMFGTDWFMVATHRSYEDFLTRFRDAFGSDFPEFAEGFMGGVALRFLGFDDPTNKNNRRLRDRYTEHGFDQPPWLRTPDGSGGTTTG